MKRYKLEIKLGKKKISLGFSLIEILVTTGVMGVVLVTALTSYNKVVRRQRFEQGVQNIFKEMKLAREMAMTGEKPAVCVSTTLDGYRLEFDDYAKTITISAVCSGVKITPPARSFNYDSTVSFGSSYWEGLFFEVMTGEVTLESYLGNSAHTRTYCEGDLVFVFDDGGASGVEMESTIYVSSSGGIASVNDSSMSCVPYYGDMTVDWKNYPCRLEGETYSPYPDCCKPFACRSVGAFRQCYCNLPDGCDDYEC